LQTNPDRERKKITRKGRELAMHCHLRQPVTPVMLSLNYETNNYTPAYKFNNSASQPARTYDALTHEISAKSN